MSNTSSTDLTSRQPGGRPGQFGYRRPGVLIVPHGCDRVVVNGDPPPWRRIPALCPAPQELRFLPRLKAGISTKEAG